MYYLFNVIYVNYICLLHLGPMTVKLQGNIQQIPLSILKLINLFKLLVQINVIHILIILL